MKAGLSPRQARPRGRGPPIPDRSLRSQSCRSAPYDPAAFRKARLRGSTGCRADVGPKHGLVGEPAGEAEWAGRLSPRGPNSRRAAGGAGPDARHPARRQIPAPFSGLLPWRRAAAMPPLPRPPASDPRATPSPECGARRGAALPGSARRPAHGSARPNPSRGPAAARQSADAPRWACPVGSAHARREGRLEGGAALSRPGPWRLFSCRSPLSRRRAVGRGRRRRRPEVLRGKWRRLWPEPPRRATAFNYSSRLAYFYV